ncbi:vacuolar protein sorting-associated protein 55 homolog [Vigna radiata var. radiata]|uniref:Vacuolar protein sorting-associated protein 55 homolog n=1 Tax=Vigna radiata var. radiata TaxID=3916 RepID=A0A1S3UR37_VIGRR|nr:vacuolar protein sorting-associated protein 55 homolog [Vigna radiata var. radiata]
MAEFPGYIRYCLNTGKLLLLAVLVSGGVVLHILACALYKNWWPMLTAITYVILPVPLLFYAGSERSSVFSDSDNTWVNATKFISGASAVGSIAIPAILKHAGVISWGALAMELSSFFVFVSAIMCYIRMNDNDDYSIL